jgi:hypothetical protein
VLVCDIPIKTPQDCSDVAQAFGFSAREELGRPPNKKIVAKNVKNANEEFEILLLHKINTDGRL